MSTISSISLSADAELINQCSLARGEPACPACLCPSCLQQLAAGRPVPPKKQLARCPSESDDNTTDTGSVVSSEHEGETSEDEEVMKAPCMSADAPAFEPCSGLSADAKVFEPRALSAEAPVFTPVKQTGLSTQAKPFVPSLAHSMLAQASQPKTKLTSTAMMFRPRAIFEPVRRPRSPPGLERSRAPPGLENIGAPPGLPAPDAIAVGAPPGLSSPETMVAPPAPTKTKLSVPAKTQLFVPEWPELGASVNMSTQKGKAPKSRKA